MALTKNQGKTKRKSRGVSDLNTSASSSTPSNSDDGLKTFWQHLDELRSVIIRVLIVLVAVTVLAFIFRDPLFSIVLAPSKGSFVTYKWIDGLLSIANSLPLSGVQDSADGNTMFNLTLINTELAQQFIIHMKTALCAGILLSLPYLLVEGYLYLSPALYARERRFAVPTVFGSYLMFMLGVIFCYFIIFPFTVRFLATYQVSADIPNTITLESYMQTFISMLLIMGIIFQMPVMSWLMAKLHILTSAPMRLFRRHVIVAILIAAAVITPTTDAFTLLIVSLPMWLLYELSIMIVKHTNK